MPSPDIDLTEVSRQISQYPVELAVLFGSYATGRETANSDVDIAVAFDTDRSQRERIALRVELIVALTEILETDAIDIADLDAIRPEVGARALQTGILLVGKRELAEQYQSRFEQQTETREETHDDRMQRFDSILNQLESQV